MLMEKLEKKIERIVIYPFEQAFHHLKEIKNIQQNEGITIQLTYFLVYEKIN